MDLSDITLTGLMRRNSEVSSANLSPTFLPAPSTTAELAEEEEGREAMSSSTDNGESHSSVSITMTTKKHRERDTSSSRQQVNK